MTKENFIQNKISGLSLDQKIGALLTLGFNGTVLTSNIYDYVEKYHCGGLRLTPADRTFKSYIDPNTGETLVEIKPNDFHFKPGVDGAELTGQEYKELLKELNDLALQRPGGLPLHFSFDNEGEGNASFKGFSMFPQPMGLRATGDKQNAYEVAKAIARQARSVGMNVIHSPVLDVNTEVRNVEICLRSYSCKAEECAEWAVESCKGFRDGGLAATGKHFPGRGDSAQDAHYSIPVIDVDFDTLWERDLLPYRVLLEQGLLPSIMLAHTVFSAIDPDDVSTVSKKLVTGLLREKMGFEGVITTDSMTMAGIASRYGAANACALSLEAGSDLLLMKAQNDLVPQTIDTIRSFVEQGRITEADLDAKVARVLGMKYDLGLFENVFSDEEPGDLVSDGSIKALEQTVARQACTMLREEDGVLPLKEGQRMLVIEQVLTKYHNKFQHPGMVLKEVLRHNRNIGFCEVGFTLDDGDRERINRLVPEYDTILATNFTDRAARDFTGFMDRLIAAHPGKTFLLLVNKPYLIGVPEHCKTVLCTFSQAPQSLKAGVEVLFGNRRATGTAPGNCDVS
jgi:beta-N-acetylhexosaminidase